MLKKCDFEEYLVFLKGKSFLLISQEDAEKEHLFLHYNYERVFQNRARLLLCLCQDHHIPTHFLARKTYVTYKDSVRILEFLNRNYTNFNSFNTHFNTHFYRI